MKASGTITRNQSGITLGNAGDAVVALIYAGEENTSHIVFNGTAAATLDANTYAGTAFGGLDAATEAFDEPLTKEQVEILMAGTPRPVPRRLFPAPWQSAAGCKYSREVLRPVCS